MPSAAAAAQIAGRRISLDDLNFLTLLGKGNFGKVVLAEVKNSKKLYAVRTLKKELLVQNEEVEILRSEKRISVLTTREKHPFLTTLHACFQTDTGVYFVMEYIGGGNLSFHLQREEFGMKRTQFYAAEICMGLKYLHDRGIMYRNLKLDNVLLALDGHVKIADYGFCKENMWYGSTTNTFCGTAEFMAPEILLDKSYGRAVDWWAFGILLYQMLLRQSPFTGEDEDEIYDGILSSDPFYPADMPQDCVGILQKLLAREPDLRIGSGPTDAHEIMDHPFFAGVNWDDIYHKRVQPLFLPAVKSAMDTNNFDPEFTDIIPVLTPTSSALPAAMQDEFSDFSWQAEEGL
ncbi:kinase-like protein [Thozetella sp. PMI_491]|nr:kinase-like protein [Thozetella sp. PMI_491]